MHERAADLNRLHRVPAPAAAQTAAEVKDEASLTYDSTFTCAGRSRRRNHHEPSRTVQRTHERTSLCRPDLVIARALRVAW